MKLALPDWWERLQQGRPLVPDVPHLDPLGDRAVAVLNKLRLSDVSGTPTMGEAGGEWFRQIVRVLFGALDPVTKVRLIRELFLLVPKKNSKTTNGALLMLTALLLNQRPQAPFIMTAPVQDVAELAFSAVAGAIALDPALRSRLHVRDHLKTIVHRVTGATLEIMTFDPAVVTGQKVVGALIDELHVIAKMPKAASALRQLRGGMLPFPEAFLAFITTQSEEAPAGIFKTELERARGIRDGTIVDTEVDGQVVPVTMMPVLYEFPEKLQSAPGELWKDPKLWPLVNPNLGRGFNLSGLVELKAKATTEHELRSWGSQHINVQIGVAMKSDSWAGAAHWDACARPLGLDLQELFELSDVVTVGIDGGGLDDLLGLCVLGRHAQTGNWLHWARAWCSRDVLERRQEIASRLLDFAAMGLLTIVDRPGADVEEVADIVEECETAGLLDRIGVDPAGIGAIVDAITARKIDHDRVVGIPQGWKLVGAIKTFERKLAGRQVEHEGAPLMQWVCGNAKIVLRGNAVLIDKQVGGTAKIDPLMASLDAVALMAMNPKPRRKKYQMLFA